MLTLPAKASEADTAVCHERSNKSYFQEGYNVQLVEQEDASVVELHKLLSVFLSKVTCYENMKYDCIFLSIN